jgi:hypothetical protein
MERRRMVMRRVSRDTPYWLARMCVLRPCVFDSHPSVWCVLLSLCVSSSGLLSTYLALLPFFEDMDSPLWQGQATSKLDATYRVSAADPSNQDELPQPAAGADCFVTQCTGGAGGSPGDDGGSSSSSSAMIIGVVIGAVVAVLILIIVGVMIYKKRSISAAAASSTAARMAAGQEMANQA